jgi:hypothetical protein
MGDLNRLVYLFDLHYLGHYCHLSYDQFLNYSIDLSCANKSYSACEFSTIV